MKREQISHSIESKVQDCVARHSPSHVCVAYSGGVDSTALLLATKAVIDKHFPQLTLMAVHVNHGLQAQSLTWVTHAQEICSALEVPLRVHEVHVAPRGNIEANARSARYVVFGESLAANGLLLLGHHEQDQTETLLYRLFQGRGLLPMRHSGKLGVGSFTRPLLAVPQAELIAYVSACNIAWIDDPSNADVNFSRNFLRRDVIPKLAQRWQTLHRSVQRVALSQQATEQAFVHTLKALGERVPLSDLPVQESQRQAWLRAYLASRGVFDVSDRALQDFISQTKSADVAELACTGARLFAYAGELYFEPRLNIELPQTLTLTPGMRVQLPYGCLTLQAAEQGQALAFPCRGALKVGFRQGGERIRTAQGMSKSVKQLLSERRVPPWRRDCYPLLYADDVLVCVPGIASAGLPAISGTDTSWVLAQWHESQDNFDT